MKARPILFSGPMVRALLDGRKTQTRRVVKPFPVLQEEAPHNYMSTGGTYDRDECYLIPRCLYGQPGDLLWVRETWCPGPTPGPDYLYRADWQPDEEQPKWKSPRYMFRRASRLTLRLTDVQVDRVQDISLEDAKAEGVTDKPSIEWRTKYDLPTWLFRQVWNRLNEQRGYGWHTNPWVWALSFDVIQANVDKVMENQS